MSYEFPVLITGLCFIGTTIAIILFILLSRIVKSRRKEESEYFRNVFSKSLNNFIVHEVYSKDSHPLSALTFRLSEIQKEMNGSFLAKQIMIDQMMIQSENLSGSAVIVIEQAYRLLELDRFSLSKLKSTRWKVRAQAIRELTKLNCLEGIPAVQAISRSSKKEMSDEALMALVRLDEQKNLQFLDKYTGTLTRWMQLNIHHHLCDVAPGSLPDFTRWFNSPNVNVQVFAIAMAGEFKQNAAIPALTNLLLHSDHRIVEAAIGALEVMEAHSPFNLLMAVADRFWLSDTTMVKLAKCMGRLVTPTNGFHALERFLSHPSYEVRFQVVRAICQFGPVERIKMENFNSANGMKYSGIMDHVNEPLLS